MARKMTEWPSKRGPITKIMPSDGCIGDTVPLAVGKWYDFHEFGWYMGNVGSDNTLRYLASTYDCGPCPLKARCCPHTPQRKIPRDSNEHARDYARSLAGTKPFETSRRERKKVEMLFAHLKRHMGFERLRLRGFSGANDEFLLAATVQNLRRLAKLAGIPPPIRKAA